MDRRADVAERGLRTDGQSPDQVDRGLREGAEQDLARGQPDLGDVALGDVAADREDLRPAGKRQVPVGPLDVAEGVARGGPRHLVAQERVVRSQPGELGSQPGALLVVEPPVEPRADELGRGGLELRGPGAVAVGQTKVVDAVAGNQVAQQVEHPRQLDVRQRGGVGVGRGSPGSERRRREASQVLLECRPWTPSSASAGHPVCLGSRLEVATIRADGPRSSRVCGAPSVQDRAVPRHWTSDPHAVTTGRPPCVTMPGSTRS